MTKYECLDCWQMSKDIEKGDRVIHVEDDVDEPLKCPWCGNQTLVEGGVK